MANSMYSGDCPKQKVQVVDAGELMSTYKFNSTEKNALREQLADSIILHEIEMLSVETSWPKEISSLEKRKEHRGLLNQLEGYLTACLDNVMVVRIEEKWNKKLPKELFPIPYYYFIINRSGLRFE